MTADMEVGAEWPERFVYICSAGGAANVNIVPMLHAGKERIAGLVIMIGLTDPENPSNEDRTYALTPAKRIREYAENVLHLDPSEIVEVRGNGDLVGEWSRASAEALDLAKQQNAEIVFNISGGRKPSTLGFFMSVVQARIADPGLPKVSLMSVGLNGFTVRLVDLFSSPGILESKLSVQGGIDLASYLATFGLREMNHEIRVETEALYSSVDPLLDAISTVIAGGNGNAAFLPFMKEFGKNRTDQFIELSKPSPDFCKILAALPSGVTQVGDRVRIEGYPAVKLLGGAWLEAMVFREAKNVFGKRNDTEFAAAFDIARQDKFKGNLESDFDLIVLKDDMVGLVECKAVTGVATVREGMNRLHSYRRSIAGHGGRAWLVAPLLSSSIVSDKGIKDQAKGLGITLLVGKGAVKQLAADWREYFRIPN